MGKHPSHPYNPLIANTFFRSGYIESWGRGIEKINRECREHGIDPPDYDYSMSGLMLTFCANPQHLAAALGKKEALRVLGEGVGEKLGETRTAILRVMLDNPKITTTSLSEKLRISTTAVDNNIRYLRSQNYLKRVGPAKGGHWEVVERKADNE